MVLTDQKEAALNALLVSLGQASDHYAQAVELLANHPSADFFARLLHLRRAAAARTAELLRSLGYLPAEPDPDRLAVSELATRFKAALSQDAAAILEHKALQLELQIEAQLVSALPLDWPQETGSLLGNLLNETRSEIGRLRAQAPG